MLFLSAGTANIVLSILHLAAIFVGPKAYIFLRAGKVMAEADANGKKWPAILTFCVAFVFFIWAMITFYAATNGQYDEIARYLTLVIGIIFTLRGSVLIFQLFGFKGFSDGQHPQSRDYIFSTLALLIGALHIWAATSNM